MRFKGIPCFEGLASYGEHYPSTKMDFDAGLELEIDSLNGREGDEVGGRGSSSDSSTHTRIVASYR